MYEMTAAQNAAIPFFERLARWGISVMRWMQAAGGPEGASLARAVSAMGEPLAYLLVFCVVFWCVDERRGIRLAIATFAALALGSALKNAIRFPRPAMRESLIALTATRGSSLPSTRALSSAAFWPTLFARSSGCKGAEVETASRFSTALRALAVVLAVAMPLAVGISRVYLGANYPQDIVLGWALGAALFFGAGAAVPALLRAATGTARYQGLSRFFAASMRENGKSPRSIYLAAAAAFALAVNAATGGDGSLGGLAFGFFSGYILLTDRKAGDEGETRLFTAKEGNPALKAARCLVGFAVLATVLVAPAAFLPGAESPWYALARFARFGAAGFWIGWGAPRFFALTKLS